MKDCKGINVSERYDFKQIRLQDYLALLFYLVYNVYI